MQQKISELLTRGIINVVPGKEKLEKLLLSGKKLNVYLGIDPTATKLHLGHSVSLRKLQQFVSMGHNVIFLIGDFTALIGDTSDKESERPILTSQEIQKNFKDYKKQAERFLDFSKVKIKFNSEWLKKLNFSDIIKLCQNFSVGDFISRELIKKRLKAGKKVRLDETLYPVMQGYDSFYLNTDVQIGGADQTFNMQAGRTLLRRLKDKESFILVTNYLNGTDGKKMSKSQGNAIWINDNPDEMFGKTMSIADSEIINFFLLLTDIPLTEIEEMKTQLEKGVNPIEFKKKLALTVVSQIYGYKEALKAKENFEKTFQKKEPEFKLEIPLAENFAGTISQIPEIGSISQAKRLIIAGSVDVNNVVTKDPSYSLKPNDNLKIGKRIFAKVVSK